MRISSAGRFLSGVIINYCSVVFLLAGGHRKRDAHHRVRCSSRDGCWDRSGQKGRLPCTTAKRSAIGRCVSFPHNNKSLSKSLDDWSPEREHWKPYNYFWWDFAFIFTLVTEYPRTHIFFFSRFIICCSHAQWSQRGCWSFVRQAFYLVHFICDQYCCSFNLANHLCFHVSRISTACSLAITITEVTLCSLPIFKQMLW